MAEINGFKGGNDYLKLAEKKANDGDFISALSYYFTAYKKSKNSEILSYIAECYSDMDLFEQSNEYWFLYLSNIQKKGQGKAYAGLSENFFYLDNSELTAYYLNKAISIGELNPDDVDPEVLDSFMGSKPKIRLVYPESVADYSKELEDGKRLIEEGRPKTAIKILKKIPPENKDYVNALEEISGAYFLLSDGENGVKTCKKLMEIKGESTDIYCKLSAFYYFNKDFEKSGYYYKKAKEEKQQEGIDLYKLAFTAFFQGDYEYSKEIFEKFVGGEEFDFRLISYYGFSLINSGDYEKARIQFVKCYKITEDSLYSYYAKLCEELKEGINTDLLPIKTAFDYPEKEIKRRIKIIENLEKKQVKSIISSMKTEDVFSAVEWGLKWQNGDIAQTCASILMTVASPKTDKVLRDYLISGEVDEVVKNGILYYIVSSERYKETSVVFNGIFTKIHQVKMPLDEEFKLYREAYFLSLCIMSASGIIDQGGMGGKTATLFRKTKGLNFKKEEIACFLISESVKKGSIDLKTLCSFLGVKEETVVKISNIFYGGKND